MKRIWTAILILILILTPTVTAQELVISENGESSSNQINLNQSSENQTTQQNQADFGNQTSQDLNTGNNSASGNTGGDSSTNTGSVNSDTSIKNSANTNLSNQQNCCPEPGKIEITGNGSGSQNTVSASSSTGTSVSQDNSAVIGNIVTGTANTGYNTANSNNGNVSLQTGDINAQVGIINQDINHNEAIVSSAGPNWNILVSGNGSDSINNFLLSISNNLDVKSSNTAQFLNKIIWESNTGGNSINSNLGDAFIKTGNVLTDIVVKNIGINSNLLSINCCCPLVLVPPTVTPPSPPSAPGPVSGNPSGGGGPAGGGGGPSGVSSAGGGGPGSSPAEVLGAAVGGIMPETGSQLFWWLTLLALIQLRIGLFLKSDEPEKLERVFKTLSAARFGLNYAKL